MMIAIHYYHHHHHREQPAKHCDELYSTTGRASRTVGQPTTALRMDDSECLDGCYIIIPVPPLDHMCIKYIYISIPQSTHNPTKATPSVLDWIGVGVGKPARSGGVGIITEKRIGNENDRRRTTLENTLFLPIINTHFNQLPPPPPPQNELLLFLMTYPCIKHNHAVDSTGGDQKNHLLRVTPCVVYL